MILWVCLVPRTFVPQVDSTKRALPICDSEQTVKNLYGSPFPKHCHPLPKEKELYANTIIVCMVPRTFVPTDDKFDRTVFLGI